jgi:hypothetical protein
MTRKGPSNLAASVRQRLMNAARQRGEDFQLVLTRYLIERLLYRLARSPHAQRFLLKGAMLFTLWTGRTHRPTRDLDLLGRGDASPGALAGVFRDLCSLEVEPDGVEFVAETVEVEAIREDQEYQGQRVHVGPGWATRRSACKWMWGSVMPPPPGLRTSVTRPFWTCRHPS